MSVQLIIGCPVADRDWGLELWFKSVRANCDPETTGLVFTVPGTEDAARWIIAENDKDFAWTELRRDHRKDMLKAEKTPGETMAFARNRCLYHAQGIHPPNFVMWDPDFILPPRTLREFSDHRIDIGTVWTWLNREKYARTHYGIKKVAYQKPVQATAMAWDEQMRPQHYHSAGYVARCDFVGFWKVAMVTKFAWMSAKVYQQVGFQDSPFGEWWGLNQICQRQGIPRYCLSEVQGVHFPEFRTPETAMGWPQVLQLADQQPLQSLLDPPDDAELAEIGYYPIEQLQAYQERETINA